MRPVTRPAAVAGALLALVAVVPAVVAVVWGLAEDEPGSSVGLLPFVLPAGALGGFLVAVRPGNGVGWALAVTGVLFAVGLLAERWALHAVGGGSLPGAAAAVWLQTWVYLPGVPLLLVGVPVLFPQGRPPSRAWRRLLVAASGVTVALCAVNALLPAPVRIGGELSVDNPLGVEPLSGLAPLATALQVLVLALGLVAVGGLLLRYRRSHGDERLQMSLLVSALALMALAFGVDAAVAALAPDLYGPVFAVVQLAPALVVVAASVAVVRHRLFDVDTLVNRSLVYLVASAVLLVAYVTLVGWSGQVLGPREQAGAGLVVTALVAVAFAPLRDRVQRTVNRLLYGERDEPHRALALLGTRLEAALAPGDVLPAVAHGVVDALRVPYAAVELDTAAGSVLAAEHGRRPTAAGEVVALPLVHLGAPTGRLVVAHRGPRAALSVADLGVLERLAQQVGAAVHGVRLADDLQRSREHLLVAREEERRRVGRDLHDGLGPQVAALAMRVEVCRDLLATDADAARERLTDLLGAVDDAVDDIRRVAHSLRPPTLDTLGLVGALRAHLARLEAVLRVELEVDDGADDVPAALEVAAYRIAQEALHNAVTHASASRCRVRLRRHRDSLEVTVSDDGRGVASGVTAGVGLASMQERAVELGGTLEVRTPPVGGTVVRALLPLGVGLPAQRARSAAAPTGPTTAEHLA